MCRSEAHTCLQPSEIALVQQSFRSAFQQKAGIATLFYHHLFEAFPGARALFKKDMHKQKEMFETVLVSIVKLLNHPEALQATADRLTRSHARYNVSPAHLALASDALVRALRDVLGPGFTPDIEAAWRKAMQILIACMAPRAGP